MLILSLVSAARGRYCKPDYERGDKIGFLLHDVDISESLCIDRQCSDFQAVGMVT